MSEQLATHEKHESLPSGQHELLTAHALPEKPKAAEKDPKLLAQEAHKALSEINEGETRPNLLDRLQAAENAPQEVRPSTINQELKQITLRRELKSIRRKLPAPQRALSAVIHQPLVRAVSEATGRTLSRPSGLLGGGLVAFLGTSGYLYLAKHMGFRYNYVVFLLLFISGFALGLILELLVFMATTKQRKASD